MPLPVVAASLGGLIISSLTVFFATRIPVILTALGLSAVVYKGLDLVADRVISGINASIAQAGGYSGYGLDAMGLIGAAGVWDALNIICSGYVSVATIKTMKVSIEAFKK